MEDNRIVVMAFYEGGLTVNKVTTPKEILSTILADDFVSYGSADSKGKALLIEQVEFFWKLIPDLKWEPQDVISEGDKFAVRSIVSGTPNGNFMGIETIGTKKFSVMTIDVHTVKEGMISTVHHLEDWTTAIQQLQ